MQGYKNQQEQAMADLMRVQQLMGRLGFTMTADSGYYKDYGLMSGGSARLVPVFDKGISVNSSFKLIGVNIVNSVFIPIVESASPQLDGVPRECIDDVMSIIGELQPIAYQPMSETFMITATCGDCGNDVASFLQISGTVKCLRCMGYTEDQWTNGSD